MNTNVYVSLHAQERIKERYGFKSKKKIQNLCNNAYNRGVRSENTKGKLRNWLDSKQRDGSYISCYQDYAFVFSNSKEVITILLIPNEVKKHMKKNILPA